MKQKIINGLLWVIADILLILTLMFIPSFFSLFCFLAALIIAPLDKLREKLSRFFNSAAMPIVLSLLIAMIVVMFPLSDIIKGVKSAVEKAMEPETSSSILYVYEPTDNTTQSKTPNNSTSKDKTDNSASEVTSVKLPTSDHDIVFRTPSGKRYHTNAECGGENSFEVYFSEAIADNLSPCKRCAQ